MKKSLGAQTFLYPTPAWVVATYDQSGRANAMTVAWAGICCSDPPAVAISLRKTTYTYNSIIQRKSFTINVPSESLVKEIDFMGMVSGRNIDKFSLTGLTAVKSELVDAPYIKEFPLVLECRLIQTVEIGLHTQFIGEIMDVKIEENMTGENGVPDVGKIKPLIFGNGLYYGIGSQLAKAFSAGKNIQPPM